MVSSAKVIVPQNLVGGAFCPAQSGTTFPRVSPTGREIAWDVPDSSAADVAVAVDASSSAWRTWSRVTAVERGNVIRRAAEVLRDRADEIVDAVVAETGKPPKDARSELTGCIEMAYFVAGEGRRLYGRTSTSAVPNKTVSFVRAPLGVAGLIVASNTPLPNYGWKVFPALLCGNAAVLKPSEDTPASVQLFAEAMIEAGVPAGALNVVHGRGPEVGGALAAHPDVAVVSFTGSVAAGRSVGRAAGARLAKVCLELGGKNAFVVCDDAVMERAVEAATLSAFSNAGQRCAAGSRLIVMDAVYDEFRDRLVARAKALRVGSDDDCDLGPVMNKRQLERMVEAVAAAQRSGASVLVGGGRLTGRGFDGGCYMAPTLLEGPRADDPINVTELFGPVSVLIRAADFEEALAVADATPFGLTAAIWTQNIDRAMAFTERMQVGMAVVNGPTYGSEPHMPFGGFRRSGNGLREAGTEALDVYSDWKTVSIIHDPAGA